MMDKFEREERYIVVKRKHLDESAESALRGVITGLDLETIECVVVEPHWPNYEHVWGTVEQVANGTWQDATEAARGECECCGYSGHDLPKWRQVLRDSKPPAPVVPEGWKLVPVEPTEEMLDALYNFIPERYATNAGEKMAFKSMLSAAPEGVQSVATEWYDAKANPPTDGMPVVGYSPDWVDEDFNPNGCRECFPQFCDSTVERWISARWVDHQDCYIEDDTIAPTHWKPMLNAAPESDQ